MTNTPQTQNENLYLPAILALLFVLGAAGLVWLTQISPAARRTAAPAGPAQEVATSGAEAPARSSAPVDLEATIAAINKGGCIACHTIPGIPGAIGQVGPDLSNIGVDAATRRAGYTAEEYIHESIANPTAFTAPECPTGPCITGAMPAIQLNETEIETVVSYLLTLGTN